ncbi:MAG: hypothetical protein MJA29_03595 [Candidatus Omnitrophica bacterium]|nr:hypothetical protein [Candidatus Omnitrophota bacterium]
MVEIDKPQLVLTADHITCNRHREPFQYLWPKCKEVFLEFERKIYYEILQRPECFHEEDLGEMLPHALFQKAACCRLPEGVMVDLYKATEVGKIGTCDRCRKLAIGTPYRIGGKDCVVRTIPHMCFECVCTNITILDGL